MALLRVNALEHETDKAVAVRDSKGKTVWFPKSQIEMKKTVKEIQITVPGWLAERNDSLEYEEDD